MSPSLTPKTKIRQKGDAAGETHDDSHTTSPSHPAAAKGVPLFLQNGTEAEATTLEREADRTANKLTAAPVPVAALPQSGGGLPGVLADHFGSQLGIDLGNVRIHTNEAAAETAVALNAKAATSGDHILFGQGEYAPGTQAGQQLLAHELAHVRQQRQGRSPSMQRKRLAGAPAKKQQALSAPSTAVPLSTQTVTAYFQTLANGNWGQSISAPGGVTVSLSGIDAKYLVPMTSLAMYMEGQLNYNSPVTGKQMPIFGPGLTVTLNLALAKHGLVDGNYRFAWVGDYKSGTIFIELLTSQPQAKNQPTTNGSTITAGGATFTAVGNWPADRLAYLEKALALIPPKALKIVTGMKFKIDAGSSSGGEDGHYDSSTHTVHLYDTAFKVSEARYGESPWPVQAIVHEIGHAIDRLPLEQAWQKAQAANSASSLTKVVSPSGAMWHKPGQNWEIDERIKKINNDFRKAASADRVMVTSSQVTDASGNTVKLDHLKGGVSEYSNQDWTELYAESFAFYITIPETLALMRPNIYKYFKARFP